MAQITDEKFNEILSGILEEITAKQLLFQEIPKLYPEISEHFNNQVLEVWEEQEAERISALEGTCKLEGTDASLDTSLCEYGFAWMEREEDFHFVYGIENNDEGVYIRFKTAQIEKGIDIHDHFSWVNWGDLRAFSGINESDLLLPQLISDLLSYYGSQNVFGDDDYYYSGLTYEEVLSSHQ